MVLRRSRRESLLFPRSDVSLHAQAACQGRQNIMVVRIAVWWVGAFGDRSEHERAAASSELHARRMIACFLPGKFVLECLLRDVLVAATGH